MIENAQERTNAIREEFNLKAVFCMHLERSGAAVVTLSTADDDPPNVLESSSAFVVWLSNIAQDIPVPLKLGIVYNLMQEMGIWSAEYIDAMARLEAMEKLEAKQEEGNA